MTLAHFFIYNMLEMSSTYPEHSSQAVVDWPRATGSAWLAGLVLGVADGFLYLLFPGVAVLFIGLAGVLFSWKGPRLAAIAGFMAGFGLCWVALLAIGIASCNAANGSGEGCRSDNAGYFLATGAAVLLLGALATWRAARPADLTKPPKPGRGLGASVGFVGALGVVAIAAALDAISDENPILPTLAWPIVVAGAIGGWLVGPRAVVARSRSDWVRTIVALAAWAVAIGAAVIVIGVWFSSADNSGSPRPEYLMRSAPLMIVTWALGVLLAGPMTLPFTLAAAGLWAALMARLRPADS